MNGKNKATSGQLVAEHRHESNGRAAFSVESDPTTESGHKLIGGFEGIEQLARAAEVPPELPGLDEEAVAKHLGSRNPSDEGNAQSVLYLYAGKFLFTDAYGWLHNVGTHWTTENAEAMCERAITHTLIQRQLAGVKTQNDSVIKAAKPNRSKVVGAKGQLASLVIESVKSFDADPDVLNCKNGVVDLRTGKLLAHEPGQRFTHCCAVDYRPTADSSAWRAWLLETVNGDTELVDWLQMAVGYSLTGHTREEILFYLSGPPRSGKGTFTETLLTLLGAPLAKEVNFSTFTAARSGDSQNFDLAPLKACRLVAASESNAYERFNEAKVKMLTGGNEVYCAFKHRDHFNYRPQFKIWLSSNQPVNADPDDDAVWGRLRVIEFPNSKLGKEDKTLKHHMRSAEVLQGVLAWAVQGAVRWYKLGSAGLPELDSAAQLKQAQREALDNVAAWVEERCELGAHYFTPSAELYTSYAGWCTANGVTPKQQRGLADALQRKGYKNVRARISGKLTRGFYGLKV